MDKTVNITGLWQDSGRVLAASSHTQPCCLSKHRSSTEAGKKQVKSSLEYGYCVEEVLFYPSFGALLVYRWTTFGDSEDPCRCYGGNTIADVVSNLFDVNKQHMNINNVFSN